MYARMLLGRRRSKLVNKVIRSKVDSRIVTVCAETRAGEGGQRMGECMEAEALLVAFFECIAHGIGENEGACFGCWRLL